MNTSIPASGLKRQARRFAADQRGGALIEFAIIIPVLLGVAYGATEACNVIAVDRKVSTTARTVSDIVAQAVAVSDTDMANVLNAGKVLLQPYPTDTLKIRVSAVQIDATKKATIVWSDASAGAEARKPNDTVTIPDGLAIANTQIIWGEVAYDFKPNSPIGALKAVWNFKYEDNQFFARPRESTGKVCRPTC